MAGLDNIFLHVTKQCNLRCKYCYFSADHAEPGEMTAMEYRRVWPDVVAARPKKIIFTGGEPLLRADLLTLLFDLSRSHAAPSGCAPWVKCGDCPEQA